MSELTHPLLHFYCRLVLLLLINRLLYIYTHLEIIIAQFTQETIDPKKLCSILIIMFINSAILMEINILVQSQVLIFLVSIYNNVMIMNSHLMQNILQR